MLRYKKDLIYNFKQQVNPKILKIFQCIVDIKNFFHGGMIIKIRIYNSLY